MDHSAFTEAQHHIEAAYTDRSLLEQPAVKEAVKSVVDAIDRGILRVCDKIDGDWVTHAWVKQAISVRRRGNGRDGNGAIRILRPIHSQEKSERTSVRVVPPGHPIRFSR